jgi:hypothetical protein
LDLSSIKTAIQSLDTMSQNSLSQSQLSDSKHRNSTLTRENQFSALSKIGDESSPNPLLNVSHGSTTFVYTGSEELLEEEGNNQNSSIEMRRKEKILYDIRNDKFIEKYNDSGESQEQEQRNTSMTKNSMIEHPVDNNNANTVPQLYMNQVRKDQNRSNSMTMMRKQDFVDYEDNKTPNKNIQDLSTSLLSSISPSSTSNQNKELEELENRINSQISKLAMELRGEINDVRNYTMGLQNQHQRWISKIVEEHKWSEEEDIQSRVDHEARVQEQIKSIRGDISDQIRSMEKRFNSYLDTYVSQQEQSINNLERISSEAVSKVIQVQQSYLSLEERLNFLEIHSIRNDTNMTIENSDKMNLSELQELLGRAYIKLRETSKLTDSFLKHNSNKISSSSGSRRRNAQSPHSSHISYIE